ncbi:MAG: Rrf2 family transcriptional regulator [Gemmatimonadetes bacterium]|nr:Rrf2 family transcriptional regulator [Gemmatimonadota bacterium]
MPLSSTAQYALRAVLHVAEHGTNEPVPADAIAADLRVPRNYLSKTLHILAQAGVLRSGRGPRGGFRLARAARITLGDIAAPFGEVSERKCLLGRATCGWKNPCSAHPRWRPSPRRSTPSFARRPWPICWARSPINRAWRPATTSRRTSNARRRAAPPPTSRARRNAVPPLPENASGSRCTTLSTHEVSRVRPCSCA